MNGIVFFLFQLVMVLLLFTYMCVNRSLHYYYYYCYFCLSVCFFFWSYMVFLIYGSKYGVLMIIILMKDTQTHTQHSPGDTFLIVCRILLCKIIWVASQVISPYKRVRNDHNVEYGWKKQGENVFEKMENSQKCLKWISYWQAKTR